MIYKYFKHIPLSSITSTIESQRNTVALPTELRRQIWQTGKSIKLFPIAYLKSAKPILPCSHPQSIVGEDELNFCVRHGNRWDLISIITDC